jgi:hypothetical protein
MSMHNPVSSHMNLDSETLFPLARGGSVCVVYGGGGGSGCTLSGFGKGSFAGKAEFE